MSARVAVDEAINRLEVFEVVTLKREKPACSPAGKQAGLAIEIALINVPELLRFGSSTADEMIVVDVDHFGRLVGVSERHWPVRPHCLVEVERAFVVTVM